MLSACSSKPQVLLTAQQKKIKQPYPKELLVYCDKPLSISEQDQLQVALKKLIENHGIYAKCYDKQKGLVDAVKRREK